MSRTPGDTLCIIRIFIGLRAQGLSKLALDYIEAWALRPEAC